MNETWTNLGTSGRRLNRIIKRLEKRFNKETDSDKLARLAQTIGILTGKLVDITKLHLGIEDAIKIRGKIK